MKNTILLIPITFAMILPSNMESQVKGNAPQQSRNYESDIRWNVNQDDLNPAFRSTQGGTGLMSKNLYASAEDSSFVIEASVMMNKKASSFMCQFHLTQVGESATVCTVDLEARIAAFKTDLSSLGIGQNDVYVDMISFIPLYEYEVTKKLFSKTANEVPSGFELKKNVHIRLQNDEILDKVIAAAAGHEIYDFARFEYFVTDHESIYDTLRKEALRILSEKNEAFKLTGLKIEPKYNTLTENAYCVFPNERYKSYSAFGSQSLGYAKRGSSITVNDVRKPNSYYYDHLPYNSFDAVIYPQLLEPQVQFVYSVRMHYVQLKQTAKP